jgi:hypothetical protein
MGYVACPLVLVTWEVMGAKGNEVKFLAKGQRGEKLNWATSRLM